MNVIEKLFGTHSERELKMIRPIVAKIEGLRSEMMAKSDEELRDQTRILKKDWQRAKHWMIFCRRHLLLCGRLQEER